MVRFSLGRSARPQQHAAVRSRNRRPQQAQPSGGDPPPPPVPAAAPMDSSPEPEPEPEPGPPTGGDPAPADPEVPRLTVEQMNVEARVTDIYRVLWGGSPNTQSIM
nr:unnamed protein product [Digitaria exilis]